MASRGNGGGGREDDATESAVELGKALKGGERILAPTRRPDGTLRKPIRIRAGYVPQDEVAIYQSKGSLWRKEMQATQEVPPGYDPVVEVKAKSKSAKRNERKKEKRQQQAALDKGDVSEKNYGLPADDSNDLPDDLEPVACEMNGLSLSGNSSLVTPSSNSTECSTSDDQIQDIDKKIRALKKKIRLTEAQQQKTAEKDMKPEQLEKISKLNGWQNELKLLEEKKAELTLSAS